MLLNIVTRIRASWDTRKMFTQRPVEEKQEGKKTAFKLFSVYTAIKQATEMLLAFPELDIPAYCQKYPKRVIFWCHAITDGSDLATVAKNNYIKANEINQHGGYFMSV